MDKWRLKGKMCGDNTRECVSIYKTMGGNRWMEIDGWKECKCDERDRVCVTREIEYV